MYLVYSNYFERLRNLYFTTVLKRFTKKGDQLLDYGSGPGDMMLLAKKQGVQAHGIDLYPRSVELAKQRHLNVKLGDYHQLAKYFHKRQFDCIFLQSVLEHIHNPIEEIQHILPYLKKEGLLILSSPTPGTYFWDDPTHVRPYTPKSFSILGDICNLTALEINYTASFILGIRVTSPLVYQLLNLLPFSLGSNLIGVFKKT